MNKSHKETISIRFISTAFIILAIAIFKPFGLDAERWQTFLHLLGLFVLGLFSCFITEVILRHIVRMPRSYDRGINYIISRNLRFQFINTLLVALLICLYRHFVMSSLVESNLDNATNPSLSRVVTWLKSRLLLLLQDAENSLIMVAK